MRRNIKCHIHEIDRTAYDREFDTWCNDEEENSDKDEPTQAPPHVPTPQAPPQASTLQAPLQPPTPQAPVDAQGDTAMSDKFRSLLIADLTHS